MFHDSGMCCFFLQTNATTNIHVFIGERRRISQYARLLRCFRVKRTVSTSDTALIDQCSSRGWAFLRYIPAFNHGLPFNDDEQTGQRTNKSANEWSKQSSEKNATCPLSRLASFVELSYLKMIQRDDTCTIAASDSVK